MMMHIAHAMNYLIGVLPIRMGDNRMAKINSRRERQTVAADALCVVCDTSDVISPHAPTHYPYTFIC
jgi:hypothetical protein